jgi:hypothetical protein
MVQPAENILSGHRQATHADGCLGAAAVLILESGTPGPKLAGGCP